MLLLLLGLIAGCATVPPSTTGPAGPLRRPVAFQDLPGWQDSDVHEALNTWRNSCKFIKGQSWQPACQAAAQVADTPAAARAFFETWFTPWQLLDGKGGDEGLITGYYEPVLEGSRTHDNRYRYPIYGVPDDLLTIDLGAEYPQLKNLRLRGRLVGHRVVPYYSRAQIDGPKKPLTGDELLWVDNQMDLFFLQIQGSGRIHLDTGETLRVGYADQNGYPYKALAHFLLAHHDIDLAQASMRGIKEWATQHPDQVQAALNSNPSYVFFRELPNLKEGPIGAQGTPLVAEGSLAIDRRYVPLGAPVYLSTHIPDNPAPFDALMIAQDTGGAIRGAIRADLFFGTGPAAGRLAGRMRAAGSMWLLLPKAAPSVN